MGDIEQRHKSSPATVVNFEFEDSRLGTKEYWEQFYDTELANFEDTGDEGEIWFGHSAELRMLKFMVEHVPLSARICDLGSGNGALLRKLRDRGYSNLCGLDYSQKAIELARRASSPSRVLEQQRSQRSVPIKTICTAPIEFKVADLTARNLGQDLQQRFDILLDKGTLDAISLCPDRTSLLERYQQNICHLFRPTDQLDDDLELLGTKESAAALLRRRQKRLLILVSCNFTKDELVDLLGTDSLRFAGELPAPSGSGIKFGGKTGNTCSAVVFRWSTEDDEEEEGS